MFLLFLIAVVQLTTRSTASPMGLFIDTSSFSTSSTYAQLVTSALTLACTSFNASTSPNRIKSIALDHLTSRDGTYLGEAIARLSPFFDCFDTVYVGTADNHNAEDMYCSALLNATFLNDYVTRSLVAATRFTLDNPPHNIPNLRWYLNYEAAGNYFGTGCTHFEVDQPTGALPKHPTVTAQAFTSAYVGMFQNLTTGLMAIRDTGGAMWSPTFNWQASFVKDRPALLGNVTDLLRNVPLLREIVNQDAIGKYSLYNISSGSFSYNLTCEDTVFYQTLLSEAATAAVVGTTNSQAAVSVNMEMFSRRNTVPQSTVTGDPMEHQSRKCCYAAHNLTIGPSWEVADWWKSQFVEWDPAVFNSPPLPLPHLPPSSTSSTTHILWDQPYRPSVMQALGDASSDSTHSSMVMFENVTTTTLELFCSNYTKLQKLHTTPTPTCTACARQEKKTRHNLLVCMDSETFVH